MTDSASYFASQAPDLRALLQAMPLRNVGDPDM